MKRFKFYLVASVLCATFLVFNAWGDSEGDSPAEGIVPAMQEAPVVQEVPEPTADALSATESEVEIECPGIAESVLDQPSVLPDLTPAWGEPGCPEPGPEPGEICEECVDDQWCNQRCLDEGYFGGSCSPTCCPMISRSCICMI